MINTLSLCPICYRKIEAQISFQNGLVVMSKTCPEHGPFSAVVEKDSQHFSNFYSEGTLGNNNAIIINVNSSCNMNCSWCYYPKSEDVLHPFSYYNMVLGRYRSFNLLLSGGEPTIRPDFFEFISEGAERGWHISAITNMIKPSEPEFFSKMLESPLLRGDSLGIAMSMQHPKNYSIEILKQKIATLQNLEFAGKKAMCAMFSIQTLDELDYIRTWYDASRNLYPMLRIRTMFGNWVDKGDKNKIWLSDLHKAFLRKFADLMPKISREVESSNLYCLYLTMKDGMQVSLSSAPIVENIDLHQCARPVFMLAKDNRCYSVPTALIVSEGMDKGYFEGFKLKEN